MASMGDVLIRLRTRGAREAQQDVKRTADQVGDLGDASRRADADAGRLGDSVRDATAEVDDLGAGAEESAGKLSEAFKAAVGVIGGLSIADAVKEAMSIDASNDELAASLGLSGKAAKAAGELAGKLYRDGYDRGLAYETVKSLDQVLDIKPGKGTEVFAEHLMDLGKVAEKSSDEITVALSGMKNNGLIDSANEGLNILTKGFIKGGARAEDLLDTLGEYGPMAHELGLSGKEFTGILAAGVKAGAKDTDQVADAMKELTLTATSASPAVSQAFKMMGLDADDYRRKLNAGGPTARKAFGEIIAAYGKLTKGQQKGGITAALFGSPGEDMGSKAIAALDPATKALGRVDEAAKRFSNTLNDNASTRIETFKNQVHDAFISALGDKAIPAIDDVITALGPYGNAIGVAAAGAATAATAFGGLTAAQWALNAAMAANPAVLAIAALTGIGVAAYTAYTRVEWFHRAVDDTWDFILSKWPLLTVPISAPLSAIAAVAENFGAVKTGARKAVDSVEGAFGSVVGFLAGMTGTVYNAAKAIGTSIVNGVVSAIQAAPNAIIDAVKGVLPESIRGPVSSALGVASTIASGPVGLLGRAAGAVTHGHRAGGGPVGRTGNWLVGEKGPEILQIPAGSNVIPNHQLAAGGQDLRADIRALTRALMEHATIVQVDGRHLASATLGGLDRLEALG